MTRPVTVVLPALADVELLGGALDSLAPELLARAAGDEVLVVDDTGRDELAPWLREHHPRVRCVAQPENRGFARALLRGAREARHELCFSMNTDVRARPGFLEPLVEALEDPAVFAAAPRVLLFGDAARVESLTRLSMKNGLVEIEQPGLTGNAGDLVDRDGPVAFAVGGTMLFRARELFEQGGFDPLYEPFYWEDVDLSWSAWRAGRRVVYRAGAVVEHHHRGTISVHGKPAWIRAAIERNRLLFQWKHLEGRALEEHLAALYRWAIDAHLTDRREDLVWLCLALEELERAVASRARATGASFEDVVKRIDAEA